MNLQESFNLAHDHYVPRGSHWYKNLKFGAKLGDDVVDHGMGL